MVAFLLVGAYLLGSVPGAYVAGRLEKGIDVRDYGSGTVSGSMVYEHVARWVIVPVGLFDVGKVLLATWAGLRLGQSDAIALATGLAAIVGHNWPVFLQFQGGRGIGGSIGVLIVLYPWGALWMLVLLAVGWRLGDSAPLALLGLAALPLLGYVSSGPRLLLPAAALLTALTLLKRLEANRRPLPPPGPERGRVILRRLLLDRDIPSHREWIRRMPEDVAGEISSVSEPGRADPTPGT